uniref:DDE Tnp4 domain-containing protein n=1 Tax=Neogobius melanostomus TaxID=47308 RepID=A0A8C6UET7_9GOBI
ILYYIMVVKFKEKLNLRHRQLQDEYVNLQQDFDKLQTENQRLKEELGKSMFSYATVKSNIAKLIFFTGLTSVMFQWLLSKISGRVEGISKTICLEDHLLIVLMKLRLGLSNIDLAYRFNVSKTTISNICRSWIPAMAMILKPLIKWPSKGAILKNMPKIFKRNFKKCRCIIDCTEIFARPSNLTARAQTWSNYKHNNTIKYLIGITPAGSISFLSPGWGGRVSDKQITMESGFVKLLEPRDEVLADRGFLIRDELAAHGATLRIPHFTKGKKQLSANEVDTSRQLSRVRIHVERVIGRWKSFKILQTVIPVSQVTMLDDIVVVCGALTNLLFVWTLYFYHTLATAGAACYAIW